MDDIPLRGVTSTAAISKHPIHPMLVPFPIAFLVGALFTDVAFLVTTDAFWARVSMWLVGAGLVTGLIAAGVGLTDFVTIARARITTGWMHMLGNATAMLLALWSLLHRAEDPAAGIMPLGLILSVAITAILGVTGWLGGELSYRYRIGVIEPEPGETRSPPTP